MKRIFPSGSLSIALVFAFLTISSCARNPVTGKQQIMLLTEEQEIAIGEQTKASAIAQYGIYQDEKLQTFLQEHGKELIGASHRPDLKWEFYVMDSPVINAFAAPGGFVFFTRGILAYFNNEAQFIGVLGHEAGHVTARHSASQISKQQLTQVGLIAGMVISPQLARMGDVLGQGAQLLFLKFSRDDESQADLLGVEYSTRLGYDAHEMAEFFNTLHRQSNGSGNAVPSFFSTHPDPGDRNVRVHQLADDWQRKLNKNEAELKVNRDSYLRLIDGIVYGEDPRQGYFDGNVFYHPELKFQFPVPSGWLKQNTPVQVVMVTKDQTAGVLLQIGEGATPREAAQKAVEKYGLTVIDSKETRVNGLPAYAMVGDVRNESSGQVMRLLVYEIQYEDLIYQFVGLADQGAFETHVSSFRSIMEGFRPLSDPARLNVQPERISIKAVPRSMTFTEAMRSFNMPGDRYEELAILNGMQLEDQLPAGTLLKVISR